MSELDWARRMFDASDLAGRVGWRKFVRKGYHVVAAPPPQAERTPVAFRWFYEGRKKDVPEPFPLPSEYKANFLEGLQTPTGKFEFVCETLKRFDAADEERPPMLKYRPSWEGSSFAQAGPYPLQLITPHTRYSFHTQGDGKRSFLHALSEHRVLVDGYHYLILRMNALDARQRGLRRDQIVRVYNDRGAVLCAVRPTSRLPRGVVHGYQASARYDPVGEVGRSADRGGSLNQLTSKRSQSANTHSLAASACVVEVQAWQQEGTAAQAGRAQAMPDAQSDLEVRA